MDEAVPAGQGEQLLIELMNCPAGQMNVVGEGVGTLVGLSVGVCVGDNVVGACVGTCVGATSNSKQLCIVRLFCTVPLLSIDDTPVTSNIPAGSEFIVLFPVK